ncbi:SET domain-containing protein [Actinoplanes sp. Pm04-4]|uniref:SET domain-containing protein n=1 Tax=Paractinoplanes pyxinae TaxID=2997416 RepID=A0ABT4BIA0_9ACTN|nr:SET domain-containing protein [Actinoplanes pyxinae]MCY1145722.1 SET domain-containing protein [Actinoplanes pyxinae]
MNDVTLGRGSLAGKGVYAARDYAAGEVVVAYHLRRLEEADYYALPAGEDLFVHSFGGHRYLCPAPARFVNHSDDPSCYQDFDLCCDIALRPISRG